MSLQEPEQRPGGGVQPEKGLNIWPRLGPRPFDGNAQARPDSAPVEPSPKADTTLTERDRNGIDMIRLGLSTGDLSPAFLPRYIDQALQSSEGIAKEPTEPKPRARGLLDRLGDKISKAFRMNQNDWDK